MPMTNDRLQIGTLYAEAAALAKVPYAVLIGVQWRPSDFVPPHAPPIILLDAEELNVAMEQTFERLGGPRYVVLHLPMLLDSLLYQAERIKKLGHFRFPLGRHARIAYATCRDVGLIAAAALCEFESLSSSFERCHGSDRRYNLTVATGETSAHDLEAHLQKYADPQITFTPLPLRPPRGIHRYVDPQITYVPQSPAAFIHDLVDALHMTPRAAVTITQIYGYLERGLDLKLRETNDLSEVWKARQWPQLQTCEEWVEKNAVCMRPEWLPISVSVNVSAFSIPQFAFPMPPLDHCSWSAPASSRAVPYTT